MLRNTFIHLPGIGYETECKIWNEGLKTWDDFINKDHKWNYLKPWILESKKNLRIYNFKFFKFLLPKRDWWRLYPEFKERTIFLDIETDPEKITMIGIYDGKRMNTFIRGIDLASALPCIKKAAVIVTYNGTGFDLPVIRNELKVNVEAIHIDLMYLLRRLGLKGGLKKIEKVVGIKRDKEIDGLSGWDAVWLWHEYKSGKSQAQNVLIRYNTADVVNLEKLLKLAYSKLKSMREANELFRNLEFLTSAHIRSQNTRICRRQF